MKISIRKFLLVNLLLMLIITTVLTTAGNYYLDKKDVVHRLDILLSQSSFTLGALLGNDFHKRDMSKLQARVNEIPKQEEAFFEMPVYQFNFNHSGRYQFQIWNSKTHSLLLNSIGAPKQPFSNGGTGFATKNIKGISWRTFTRHNPKLGVDIEVAEKVKMRSLLTHRLISDDIYIVLLTYPIAGLLIWFIIGRALGSIKRVTEEVAYRLPTYLEPVDAKSVPIEIKPLVVELNRLFLKLQQAFEREKRFAGDAAHELRTPLAALKTQAQVALRTTDESERNTLLKNVIYVVDRCAHVVQQLLTLSRLAPEATGLGDITDINLVNLAAEIIAQLAPAALEKNIDISLVAKKQTVIIPGNVTALSILIRNLVDNAIRYTPEGGEVQISIRGTRTKVVLTIMDNGQGIPAELRARVFERFYRVLGNKSPGSGLGLSIVQQIAQLHNAQVKLGPPETGKGLEVNVIFEQIDNALR